METRTASEIKSVAPFELHPLPYAQDALEPYITEKTISFHYGKHHQKYVSTTNELIKGTPFESSSLEQIIHGTADKTEFQKLFNNAAQAWNHWFYWNCLTPNGGHEPRGAVKKLIDDAFGSYDGFRKELTNAAVGQFGSGYAWVAIRNEKPIVMKYSNADNPLAHGFKPLFCIDVWEHAYYLDYQNRREDHIKALIANLINWDFFEYNLSTD